jgi:diguanylate cyclase (GGDEF)-like protein
MRNRSELVFRYKMEGLQPDWIDSTDGMAIFPSLEPGTYTFTVIACNPGMNAYSTPVRVRIVILPPWWKSWWFYLLLGLSFVLLLVSLAALFARHTRARSRELERLVSKRTRELEASREQLRIQATHDGLTGMLNRAAVLRALAVEMDRARREQRQLIVALVDLDHFKHLNDAHGHLAGDEALRIFAAAVNAAIRPYDHAGRYGGEEFLLVLTDMPLENMEQRVASLHASISNLKVILRESSFTLNCSLGASGFDPSVQNASEESVIGVADMALYEAKASGRDRAVFHPLLDRGQTFSSDRFENDPVH